MTRKNPPAFFLWIWFALPGTVCAQLRIDHKETVEFYVRNVLLGPGVEAGNISFKGVVGGIGQFEADSSILGLGSGLVLSSGCADSLSGPNQTTQYTSYGMMPTDFRIRRELRKGDKDLNRLARRRTIDVAVVEFDFVPVKNTIEFSYVFGSEEYPEFVGSRYNDAFGFFLSGPGIKRRVNLAVLPHTKTPITINSVNHKWNKKYFRRNDIHLPFFAKLFMPRKKKKAWAQLHEYIELDGLTVRLRVHYDVIPYQKYHIKIAVGDVSDGAFDSAVFLEAGSFVSLVDTAGKYYEKLEAVELHPPDIDSILGAKLPADTLPEPVMEEEDFTITDIYFGVDLFTLDDTSKTQLDKLAEYLLKNGPLTCSLEGFTDNTGSKKYNQRLSEQRALAVMEYLVQKGVHKERLRYEGHNFENPKSNNDTEEGRARNRRVEIVINEPE